MYKILPNYLIFIKFDGVFSEWYLMPFNEGGVSPMLKKMPYNSYLDMDSLELAVFDLLESEGVTPFELEVSEVNIVKECSKFYDIEVKFNAEVDSEPGRIKGSVVLRFEKEEAFFEGLQVSFSS